MCLHFIQAVACTTYIVHYQAVPILAQDWEQIATLVAGLLLRYYQKCLVKKIGIVGQFM